MPAGRQAVWNNRVVSIVHALVVAAGCTRVLWCDPDVRASLLLTYSPAATVYSAVFLGFTTYDLGALTTRVGDKTGAAPSALMFVHHLFAILMACFPLTSGRYAYVTALYLLNEWSTPLLHARYWMSDVGMAHSHWAYQANQLLFVLVFFVARVCLDTVLLAAVTYACLFDPQHALILYDGYVTTISVGIFLAALFFSINTYWFILIVRKGLESAGRRPSKPKDT
jgi:hypothetical protein